MVLFSPNSIFTSLKQAIELSVKLRVVAYLYSKQTRRACV